jgi:Fe-S oxidoreductase
MHRWKEHRAERPAQRHTRGKVVYFHDTFATYNYPHVGIATVKLLEAAGFEVVIEERRVCCGRPMLSKGLVTEARRMAKRNVSLLARYARDGVPIIGSEPSCILTLRDEYPDLLPEDADMRAVADHAYMIDEFLAKLDGENDLGITWTSDPAQDVFFHGHCHQKALIGVGASMAIMQAAGCNPTESGAGCCGMAGSFCYETEHYDVSRKVGEERLFPAVNEAPEETVVAVAGVSCRQQIEHFTDRSTRHIAEVLASRIAPDHVWKSTPSEPIPADVTPTPESLVQAEHPPEGPA